MTILRIRGNENLFENISLVQLTLNDPKNLIKLNYDVKYSMLE